MCYSILLTFDTDSGLRGYSSVNATPVWKCVTLYMTNDGRVRGPHFFAQEP